MLNKLFRDESGVIISAELALVLTIAVLAMVVGLSEVAVAVTQELNDISDAVGSLNQSFSYTGFTGGAVGKVKSNSLGSKFSDTYDDCDFLMQFIVVGVDVTTTENKNTTTIVNIVNP